MKKPSISIKADRKTVTLDKYAGEWVAFADGKVVAQLNRHIPGLAAQVEMRDLATPMTYERYTGNWQGNYQGWLFTVKSQNMRMSKTLPGLANFYMVGQWVQPGDGVNGGIMSGRYVTQIICKQDKKKFVTSTP